MKFLKELQMSIVYLLKKEGIVNIKPLDSNQIKTIAKDIAIKLCHVQEKQDIAL